jgi:hypothetical protein
MTVTNQNYFHKDDNSRLNSRNFSCHSVHSVLSSHVLSKYSQFKIFNYNFIYKWDKQLKDKDCCFQIQIILLPRCPVEVYCMMAAHTRSQQGSPLFHLCAHTAPHTSLNSSQSHPCYHLLAQSGPLSGRSEMMILHL